MKENTENKLNVKDDTDMNDIEIQMKYEDELDEKIINWERENKSQCDICLRYVLTKNLQRHKKEVHENKKVKVLKTLGNIQCEECGEKIVQETLEKHMQRKHNNAIEKQQCKFCDKYISKPNISKHLKTHKTNEFICEYCGKTFRLLASHTKHIKKCQHL